jgi:hypothetical protein
VDEGWVVVVVVFIIRRGRGVGNNDKSEDIRQQEIGDYKMDWSGSSGI